MTITKTAVKEIIISLHPDLYVKERLIRWVAMHNGQTHRGEFTTRIAKWDQNGKDNWDEQIKKIVIDATNIHRGDSPQQ